ncbi:hypothetical protein DFJ73DRAFT_937488, partial [Zopfochytrium polystomum]
AYIITQLRCRRVVVLPSPPSPSSPPSPPSTSFFIVTPQPSMRNSHNNNNNSSHCSSSSSRNNIATRYPSSPSSPSQSPLAATATATAFSFDALAVVPDEVLRGVLVLLAPRDHARLRSSSRAVAAVVSTASAGAIPLPAACAAAAVSRAVADHPSPSATAAALAEAPPPPLPTPTPTPTPSPTPSSSTSLAAIKFAVACLRNFDGPDGYFSRNLSVEAAFRTVPHRRRLRTEIDWRSLSMAFRTALLILDRVGDLSLGLLYPDDWSLRQSRATVDRGSRAARETTAAIRVALRHFAAFEPELPPSPVGLFHGRSLHCWAAATDDLELLVDAFAAQDDWAGRVRGCDDEMDAQRLQQQQLQIRHNYTREAFNYAASAGSVRVVKYLLSAHSTPAAGTAGATAEHDGKDDDDDDDDDDDASVAAACARLRPPAIPLSYRLYLACENGRLPAVVAFLSHPSTTPPYPSDPDDERDHYVAVAASGDLALLDLLLRRVPNPDDLPPDAANCQALVAAAAAGHHAMLARLLELPPIAAHARPTPPPDAATDTTDARAPATTTTTTTTTTGTHHHPPAAIIVVFPPRAKDLLRAAATSGDAQTLRVALRSLQTSTALLPLASTAAAAAADDDRADDDDTTLRAAMAACLAAALPRGLDVVRVVLDDGRVAVEDVRMAATAAAAAAAVAATAVVAPEVEAALWEYVRERSTG